MNILYAGTLPPHPGGTAIVGFQLLVGLAQAGHSVRALAPMTPDVLAAGDAFAVAHPELGVSRYLVPYFESSPDIASPTEYRALEGRQINEKLGVLIAQSRPDIIIIGRETFAWHVPGLATNQGLPSVLLVQGATTWGMLNGTIPYDSAQELLGQYRKASCLVAVAEHLAKHVERLGFSSVQVIPNPVNLDLFSPRAKDQSLCRALAIQRDDVVVVHVSNLKMLKRPMDIVDSAEKALHQNPNLYYIIVGDGHGRTMMEKACRDKRISDRFRFTGWVDYEHIPDYLNLADIVVMPSEAEAQALVYLETQACGRLLLASDIAGAREVITDGKTGLLYRRGDIDDLAAKTLYAAGDPEFRANIGRNAREHVKSHDLNRTLGRYLACLENVIRQHRAA